ncbi:hypothetical protein EI94DRAFT_1829391 [Lactarius quietus]|nr:hypothetical protein EI94DRAFT_1829391 [Lactarius quietus]
MEVDRVTDKALARCSVILSFPFLFFAPSPSRLYHDPPSLQGLNLVQPAQPSDSYLANSNDLLNLSHFPGLSAQLDIWSNVDFESDEPLVRKRDKKLGGEVHESTPSVEDDEDEDVDDGQPARADNHDNVVMGDPIPTPPAQPRVASRPPLNAFDIGSLLASFGIDPFMASSVQSTSATPSLAQILSLYPNAALPPMSSSTNDSAPAAKRSRPRTRVSSISASTGEQSSDAASPADATAMTPLTPAEDKRRRNTAASARFRLKKKEREAALEKKSKELEMRVMELERECEGLRRENGWLKGLVVGVTGVGTAQQQQPQAAASAGVKRPREDVDVGSN